LETRFRRPYVLEGYTWEDKSKKMMKRNPLVN
jgi:hypothetical protein